MTSTEIVRAMDTEDESELSVGIYRSIHTGDNGVVLTDSTGFPYHRTRLTVAEARLLAEFLNEQADAADDLNA